MPLIGGIVRRYYPRGIVPGNIISGDIFRRDIVLGILSEGYCPGGNVVIPGQASTCKLMVIDIVIIIIIAVAVAFVVASVVVAVVKLAFAMS